MASSLFDNVMGEKRQRLRQLGWYRAGTPPVWRQPDGHHLSEEEAFLWLERYDKPNGLGGQPVHAAKGDEPRGP